MLSTSFKELKRIIPTTFNKSCVFVNLPRIIFLHCCVMNNLFDSNLTGVNLFKQKYIVKTSHWSCKNKRRNAYYCIRFVDLSDKKVLCSYSTTACFNHCLSVYAWNWQRWRMLHSVLSIHCRQNSTHIIQTHVYHITIDFLRDKQHTKTPHSIVPISAGRVTLPWRHPLAFVWQDTAVIKYASLLFINFNYKKKKQRKNWRLN